MARSVRARRASITQQQEQNKVDTQKCPSELTEESWRLQMGHLPIISQMRKQVEEKMKGLFLS